MRRSAPRRGCLSDLPACSAPLLPETQLSRLLCKDDPDQSWDFAMASCYAAVRLLLLSLTMTAA